MLLIFTYTSKIYPTKDPTIQPCVPKIQAKTKLTRERFVNSGIIIRNAIILNLTSKQKTAHNTQ